MNLRELQKAWEEDSRINEDNILAESLKIPQIHSRWLNRLSSINLLLKKQRDEMKRIEILFEGYYTKNIYTEELQLPRRQELTTTLESAKKLMILQPKWQETSDRLNQLEEMASFINQVMKSIDQRTWYIKNYIEWMKFTHGQMI